MNEPGVPVLPAPSLTVQFTFVAPIGRIISTPLGEHVATALLRLSVALTAVCGKTTVNAPEGWFAFVVQSWSSRTGGVVSSLRSTLLVVLVCGSALSRASQTM